jgi:hypothetical protein
MRGPAPPGVFAISHETQAGEAEQHHRPGRGFRDSSGSDNQREVLVRPGSPRPLKLSGRDPDGRKGLAAIGRGVRQGMAGDIARRNVKRDSDADEVSAATTGNASGPAAKTRGSSDPGVDVDSLRIKNCRAP